MLTSDGGHMRVFSCLLFWCSELCTSSDLAFAALMENSRSGVCVCVSVCPSVRGGGESHNCYVLDSGSVAVHKPVWISVFGSKSMLANGWN